MKFLLLTSRNIYRNQSFVRGFTLIELLVVIAIIGILSAVVLASLSTARAKGTDASIKSSFDTIRTQAELDYDTNISYGTGASNGTGYPATVGTLCNENVAGSIYADTVVQNAIRNIATLNKATATTLIDCGVTPSAYSIAAALTSTGAGYWCVDNTGVSRRTTSLGVAYTALVAASTGAHATAGATTCQ